jgi:hypothetical protein
MNRSSICTFTLAVAGSIGTGIGAPHSGDDLADRLVGNPILSARIQALLPPGTSLQAAAAGFRDETEFVTALHVSRNLNIPFKELRADLSRSKHHTLTGALQDLRPELRAAGINRQMKRAEQQAKADLQQAGELAENTGK